MSDSGNAPATNIIGAGLTGLSAALTLAGQGRKSRLISVQSSERAQSNLAEGGINAALNVSGEMDSVEEHFADTMRAGCYLADPIMVRQLTKAAPQIVQKLQRLGVPFAKEDGRILQRYFGGQKKKRTAFVKSSTGKALMAAMIDAVRQYEVAGLVERYSHHCFERLFIHEDRCLGAQCRDAYTEERKAFPGPVIVAAGGMNGMFFGHTTGTTANTGSVTANLFEQGVVLSNLEFIQYHPTTVSIPGKRLLISEAARGEGGRLMIMRDGRPCYFMEEKYGPDGNRMPRDVISREMALLSEDVFLDLRGLSQAIWERRLPDLRDEIQHYLGMDPAKEPVPVAPGIHYCMGGIRVDEGHRTNRSFLYAAGECACAYHGANRLGGNSLLGAIFGGRCAAESVMKDLAGASKGNGNARRIEASNSNENAGKTRFAQASDDENGMEFLNGAEEIMSLQIAAYSSLSCDEQSIEKKMEEALFSGLSILRNEERLTQAHQTILQLYNRKETLSDELRARLHLAEAMLLSALERKESRGAHTRMDYPETKDAFRAQTCAKWEAGRVGITFEKRAL